MTFRISPLWWPFLAAASPLAAPFLLGKNRRFKKNIDNVANLNRNRLQQAEPLDLPELEFLELTVLVEEKTEEGFLGDAGGVLPLSGPTEARSSSMSASVPSARPWRTMPPNCNSTWTRSMPWPSPTCIPTTWEA